MSRISDHFRKTLKTIAPSFRRYFVKRNPRRKETELPDGNEDYARFMATFHSKLVQSRDISRIDFAEYMRSLTFQLSNMHLHLINP